MYRRDLRDTDADRILADAAMVDTVTEFQPDPDGDRIAYVAAREDRSDLWVLEDGHHRRLTGEGATGMAGGHLDETWIDWHPDGDTIAYSAPGEQGLDVWTVDPESGEKTQLTSGPGQDVQPKFSPDGTEIAFVTDDDPPGALVIVSTDGQRTEILRDDEYHYMQLRWAETGDLYAARSYHRDHRDRACEVVQVDRDGTVEVVYAEEGIKAYAPRPRPGSDGELAFVHDETGYDAIYLDEGDGSEPTLLFGAEGVVIHAPEWNENGDRLAVVVTERGDQQLHVIDVEGTEGTGGDTAERSERISDGVGERTDPRWHDGDVLAIVTTPTEPYSVRNVSTGETLASDAPAGLDERFVEPEELLYEADDGLEIHAIVYPPPGIEDADENEIPLIVHPHGGPTTFDGYAFNPRAQYFAVQGYAVIEPNYRGSSGFGREFRDRNDHAWGEGDLDDVIAAADALADAYPAVDGERAGIFGGSGGGLMTVNALGNSGRFDAGAAFYGVYDYEAFMDDTDDVGWRLMKRELGFPATEIENYRDASPIETVDQIDAPLLVLHGDADVRVPISQSELLVEELERHGVRHEFRRYEGEPHGFQRRENVLDAYSRVADLFAKYLQVDPDNGSSRPWTPPEE